MLKKFHFLFSIFFILGCNSEKHSKKITSVNSICDTYLHAENKSLESVKLNIPKIEKDSFFNLLSFLNLGLDNWFAIINVAGYKEEFIKEKFEFPGSGYYYLNDIDIIRKMQQDWISKKTSGDCCTPDLSMEFYKNGQFVFSAGLIIDDSMEGFQDQYFGFSPVKNKGVIKKYFRYFKPCN